MVTKLPIFSYISYILSFSYVLLNFSHCVVEIIDLCWFFNKETLFQRPTKSVDVWVYNRLFPVWNAYASLSWKMKRSDPVISHVSGCIYVLLCYQWTSDSASVLRILRLYILHILYIYSIESTPTDRPKSVHNLCVIEVLVAFLCCHVAFLDFLWV